MGLMLAVLHVVTVLAAGLASGAQILVATSIAPAILRFPAPTAVRIHQAMLDHAQHVFTIQAATMAATFCGIAVLILGGPFAAPPALLTALGVLATISVGVTTVIFQVPLNVRVREWRTDEDAEQYRELQKRWGKGQAVRMTFGLVAFLAFTLAAIVR